MIQDRGNKKWTAMMLTEHVREIREWYERDDDIEEPKYDDFKLNTIADELNIAYQSESNVRIRYWMDKRVKEVEGQIINLIPNEHAIKIKTTDSNTKLILEHIMKVNIYD